MSIMNLNKIAVTVPQPVFYLRGVPYLPHYASRHLWVGPGRDQQRKMYTTVEMQDAQARLSTMHLWERHWTKDIRGWRGL